MTVPNPDWTERLKWAEDHGLKNLQEKFTTGDNMNKEAQTTLTYILAGMGGTFAYVLPALDKAITPVVFGTAMLCLYFAALAVVLVWKTFFLGAFPSPYQQPKALLAKPDLALDVVRQGELLNIDDRIDEATAWITKKGNVINGARAFLVGSPLVFVIAVFVFKKFQ